MRTAGHSAGQFIEVGDRADPPSRCGEPVGGHGVFTEDRDLHLARLADGHGTGRPAAEQPRPTRWVADLLYAPVAEYGAGPGRRSAVRKDNEPARPLAGFRKIDHGGALPGGRAVRCSKHLGDGTRAPPPQGNSSGTAPAGPIRFHAGCTGRKGGSEEPPPEEPEPFRSSPETDSGLAESTGRGQRRALVSAHVVTPPLDCPELVWRVQEV